MNCLNPNCIWLLSLYENYIQQIFTCHNLSIFQTVIINAKTGIYMKRLTFPHHTSAKRDESQSNNRSSNSTIGDSEKRLGTHNMNREKWINSWSKKHMIILKLNRFAPLWTMLNHVTHRLQSLVTLIVRTQKRVVCDVCYSDVYYWLSKRFLCP